MSALAATVAHYGTLADAVMALRLVEQMRALERASIDAEKARTYCGPEDQQRFELAELDARTDLYRTMGQLGLDMRVSGSAMA